MRFLGCVLLFLVAFAVHAGIYKWVDVDGKVHYSDKKEAATKQVTIKTQTSPQQEELSQSQQRYDKLIQSEKMHKLKKEEQLKKDAEAQTKLEDKKKRCLKLLDEIEHTKYARAVYYKSGDDKKVYVDDTTRDQHINKAQNIYDEHCR